MQSLSRDSYTDLERHRLSLEQNVAKLRASLQHWQAWEIEYEGLREDISSLEGDESQTPLEDLQIDTGPSIFPGQRNLLTSNERSRLLRDEKGALRGSQQVLGLLSHRVDYVQKNIKTTSSLLSTAEEKLATIQVLSQPEVWNEEGLPLTEILEELDEQGNVLSGSLSEPGQGAPQVVEALRKAGIKELPEDTVERKPGSSATNAPPKLSGRKTVNNSELVSNRSETSARPKISRSLKPRKSVSFAEDTKEEHVPRTNPPPKNNTERQPNQRRPAEPRINETTSDRATGNRSSNITVYDEEEDEPFQAVIPEGESSEDAELRQQMIQYNMGEVGAIVAELDLDEDELSYSDKGSGNGDLDNSSVDEDENEDEDEDDFGRTKRRILQDDYLAEMRKLEQKMKNIGPHGITSVNGKEAPKRSNTTAGSTAAEGSKSVASKGVRFAGELDIQKAPVHLPQAVSLSAASKPIEPSAPPRKPIHAATVIERPYTASTSSSKATKPDELDPSLLRQEVSTEYHRMRNHMIQRQGGFTACEDADEEGRVPLTEAEGGPKKMSRFKAARLGKLSG